MNQKRLQRTRSRFPPTSLILRRQHTFLGKINVFLAVFFFFFSNQRGINVTALETMSPSTAGKQKLPK